MFNNKLDKKYGIEFSRWIASWERGTEKRVHAGRSKLFEAWLRSLDVDEEDIRDIQRMAENGKMELEVSAKKFMSNKLDLEEEEFMD